MLSKVDFAIFFPSEPYQTQQIPNEARFFRMEVISHKLLK